MDTRCLTRSVHEQADSGTGHIPCENSLLTTGTHRHSILNMEKWDYAFDPDKNAWLIRERGISFEQIIALIESGNLVQVLEHHDRERYPNQLLYEVDVEDISTSSRSSENTRHCS